MLLNVTFLHMQSVHISTNIVSSKPAHGEVYSIQHYLIKFVSDLWQVGVFCGYSGLLLMAKKSYIKWENNDVIFVLDFYSAISLKQQSAGRHDAPLERNSLIPSQPTNLILLKVALNTIKQQTILWGSIDPNEIFAPKFWKKIYLLH
jgi:hypothetical protein